MEAKLKGLCEGLERRAGSAQFDTDPAAKAAALLRAYDMVAEFAEHGASCLFGYPHTVNGVDMREHCDCGLLGAQRRVAEILESL